MDEIKNIQFEIRKFRDKRDWMQFHNPKNMAASLVIESAELLEIFQWASLEESETICEEKKTEIANEIADIAIYLFEIADNLDIDIKKAVMNKMRINEKRYPIPRAKGSAKKYSED